MRRGRRGLSRGRRGGGAARARAGARARTGVTCGSILACGAENSRAGAVCLVLDIRAGFREYGVDALLGTIFTTEVGLEDLGAVGESNGGSLLVRDDRALRATSLDVDDGTRHVVLPVTGLVHPSPCEDNIVTFRGVRGNSEVEGAATCSRAASNEGLDDGEGCALVV